MYTLTISTLILHLRGWNARELPDPSGPRRRRSMSEAKDIAQKAKIAAEKSGAGASVFAFFYRNLID